MELDWSPDRIHIYGLYMVVKRTRFIDTNRNTNRRIGIGPISRRGGAVHNRVVPPEAKISGDLEIDTRFGSSPLSSKASVVSKSISKRYIFLEIDLETCVRTDGDRVV